MCDGSVVNVCLWCVADISENLIVYIFVMTDMKVSNILTVQPMFTHAITKSACALTLDYYENLKLFITLLQFGTFSLNRAEGGAGIAQLVW